MSDKTSENVGPLKLCAMGMVTSVGLTTTAACASIRADLSRSRMLPHVLAFDAAAHVSVPAVGRPISGYTDGFFLIGCWLRMAIGCLEDLRNNYQFALGSDQQFWSETGLVINTWFQGDGRFGGDTNTSHEPITRALIDPLRNLGRLSMPAQNVVLVCEGHVGTCESLREAHRLISSRQLRRVIVLSVDSWLDPLTIEWLQQNHRMLSDETSDGLIPGEAAAAFVVELPTAKSNDDILVGPPGFGAEEIAADGMPQAIAFQQAVTEAVENSGLRLEAVHGIISDMNGEPRRAYEVGCARHRMAQLLSADCNWIYPAVNLGETGAASGAVAICVAARALQRRYYGSGNAMLAISSSAQGRVAAVSLFRATGTAI